MGDGDSGRCRVVVNGEPCGKPRTRFVAFVDGDVIPSCEECALNLQQTAQSHGAGVHVTPAPVPRG